MTKVQVSIHEYTNNTVRLLWEPGFTIRVTLEDGACGVIANAEGLISLARHMLTLAQDQVPVGVHLHLDDLNSMEPGSAELIIERGPAQAA